ncbi:unnamed protein product [Sympodiomycopsis kandeliae]
MTMEAPDKASKPPGEHKHQQPHRVMTPKSGPITIARALPSTAAAVGTSEVPSSASSFSDYHSSTSTASATALLAHLSPRPRTASRSNSLSSNAARPTNMASDHYNDASEADGSSDAGSITFRGSPRTSPTSRRRSVHSNAPALLKTRPLSVATTASVDSSFDLSDLEQDIDQQSLSGRSQKVRSFDKALAPSSASRKGKGKASTRLSMALDGSADLSESAHNSSKESRAAAEELRKLQNRTHSKHEEVSSASSEGLAKAPPEIKGVLEDAQKDQDGAGGSEDAAKEASIAGHAEHTLLGDELVREQQAAEEQQHEQRQSDLNERKQELLAAERLSGEGESPALTSERGDQHYHPLLSADHAAEQARLHQLKRRRGYRSLSQKASNSSIDVSSEESMQKNTSSSSLEERLSNTKYTSIQTASQLRGSRFDRQSGPTSIERQMQEDAERIKSATKDFLRDIDGTTTDQSNALSLMISLSIQLPGMSTFSKKFLSSTPHPAATQDQITTTPTDSSRRRQPDLLSHQGSRVELFLTKMTLNRRSVFTKLFILGVLVGSWFWRSTGFI